MENNIREFNVFITTVSDKVFIGSIFATSSQQAKIKALECNNAKSYIKHLTENNKNFSVVAELSDTRSIFK